MKSLTSHRSHLTCLIWQLVIIAIVKPRTKQTYDYIAPWKQTNVTDAEAKNTHTAQALCQNYTISALKSRAQSLCMIIGYKSKMSDVILASELAQRNNVLFTTSLVVDKERTRTGSGCGDYFVSLSASTMLVGWQEGHLACKSLLCHLCLEVVFQNKWRKKTKGRWGSSGKWLLQLRYQQEGIWDVGHHITVCCCCWHRTDSCWDWPAKTRKSLQTWTNAHLPQNLMDSFA